MDSMDLISYGNEFQTTGAKLENLLFPIRDSGLVCAINWRSSSVGRPLVPGLSLAFVSMVSMLDIEDGQIPLIDL